MNPEEFSRLAELLKDRTGIVLGRDKEYLAESRLAPVARSWGFNSPTDLVRALVRRTGSGASQELLSAVVEAMTTNESFFFRDQTPFDQFRDVMLPNLMKARADTRRIRIWSAACSSGQEPYSLAMAIRELGAKVSGWRFDILATDLSKQIMNRAQDGVYTQFEVQRGLPIQYLAKYFEQEGDRWRIKRDIRDMVTFRAHNLLDSARPLGKFDIVFCRNVLIYFNQDTKRQVLDNISEVLASDGYLTLGGAETVLGLTDKFQAVSGYRGLFAPTSAQKKAAAPGR
ncbi:chemotaxis protein methyltransferase CheR [Limimonas halophila]|uniref:protein-glutamate O-methyltransferase n=1 Tax=Limimonas halophila TaxID=1082479 RepID=A0A1G7M3C0_9PROT|nr:protein-glutamate O-methyltransferase [Limimonas halophila]SDF56124.1 chemotaxis protein methyltransferase CheR [Limimonas halophila]